jgi:CheY-like chemotaxis protein
MLVDASTKPDVLVSDLGMPRTDGFDLIRRVRDNAETRYLAAIAVTAYANPTERLRALAAGYQAHLPKPIDPTVVAITISDLVAGARSASATAS